MNKYSELTLVNYKKWDLVKMIKRQEEILREIKTYIKLNNTDDLDIKGRVLLDTINLMIEERVKLVNE